MPRKPTQPPAAPSLDTLLDDALGGILSQGWDESGGAAQSPPDAPVAPVVAPSKPVLEYPPLPVRGAEPAPVPSTLAVVERSEAAEDDEEDASGLLDIGLLTDLAAGRKGAVEAARAAGVTEAQLQSSLAVALREVDPKEIAKAMGLQAAEQQLKSGAIYGAVLADLVADMAAGRLKPETKIELAKLLANVGRVMPKEDKNVSAGGGFTLNINLAGAGSQPVIIDAN